MFKDLLKKAVQQPEQQRLLFLFASSKESNKSRKQEDKKGVILPVMVVDKLPEEITDFHQLVSEADSIDKSWSFVFIASLPGTKSSPPKTEEAEPYLNSMANDVLEGNNIHRYVVFDRQENPIELCAT